MNSRGQSALEYLMTYGWALIVIAIVVGLLIYILSSTTTGGAVCSVNTTQFNLQEYIVQAGTNNAKFVIQNATGRKVTFGGVENCLPTTCVLDSDINNMVVTKGNTVTLTVDGPAAGTFAGRQLLVNYSTTNLGSADFNIVCSGSV